MKEQTLTSIKFGERLKKIRKDKKLTLDDLASTSDLGKTQLSRYENGRQSPTLETIISLQKALGVSFDYLVGGINPDDRPTGSHVLYWIGVGIIQYDIKVLNAHKDGDEVRRIYLDDKLWSELMDKYFDLKGLRDVQSGEVIANTVRDLSIKAADSLLK